jgi:hypothetical protein
MQSDDELFPIAVLMDELKVLLAGRIELTA